MNSPYDDGPHAGRPRGGSQSGPGGYPPPRPAGPPPGQRQPGRPGQPGGPAQGGMPPRGPNGQPM
ncbi:hypothetical protein, partial [Nocardia jejuensis]|uniref:hypothetical protein n=1 Tax=Nocardia jejuensis TaxID=328049 RepID=UPI001C3FC257